MGASGSLRAFFRPVDGASGLRLFLDEAGVLDTMGLADAVPTRTGDSVVDEAVVKDTAFLAGVVVFFAFAAAFVASFAVIDPLRLFGG